MKNPFKPYESENTKQTKAKLKNQKKETTTMSNKNTVIVTVASTLAVVAVLAAIFYAGTQYQNNLNDQIANARAEAVASSLKTSQQK